MKLALMMAPRMHPADPQPPQRFYQSYVTDTLRAEEIGFDYAFYGEHHLRPCQWTPSPLMLASYCAAKTRRIRLGMSVICLPFHHPLRLAEDVATLDALCGGRFDLGVGVGSQWEEFNAWNIDPAERFGRSWEIMDILEKCFRSPTPFTHQGKYYQLNDVDFTTKPVQKDLPIWWGGMGPKNVQKAAERGYHLYGQNAAGYDQALRAAGRNPADYIRSYGRGYLSIADTKQQALDDAIEGYHYFRNFYLLRRRLDGTMPDASEELTRDRIRAENEAGLGGLIADSVQGAKARIMAALQNVPKSENYMLPFLFRGAGQSDESVNRTFDLFARHILPEIRAWSGKA